MMWMMATRKIWVKVDHRFGFIIGKKQRGKSMEPGSVSFIIVRETGKLFSEVPAYAHQPRRASLAHS